jgi:hypothetical protein
VPVDFELTLEAVEVGTGAVCEPICSRRTFWNACPIGRLLHSWEAHTFPFKKILLIGTLAIVVEPLHARIGTLAMIVDVHHAFRAWYRLTNSLLILFHSIIAHTGLTGAFGIFFHSRRAHTFPFMKNL